MNASINSSLWPRMMRTGLCAFMLTAIQPQLSDLYAQNVTVTLSMRNATVEQVLDQIEKKTEYTFVASDRTVDLNRKVSLNVQSLSLEETLKQLFAGTNVSYKIVNNQIILSKAQATQQSKRVKGTVVDKNGEPIIGANVVVKGTTNGTITDIDGKFSLEAATGSTLTISYIGYLNQDVKVGNQQSLMVRMNEDTQNLDEVVVVGYGTQKKGEIASAITSIKSEKFVKTPTNDAAQLIKGQVPGLSITTPDANPTSTSEISLRGITTLKASASPLVLIDGIPGSLNSVSPDDIQQIDVLKDGSAAAIYGTRGTNGVILITTKNANGEMPTEVDVNAYISTQQIVKKLPFMDATEYRQRVQEGVPGAQDDGATTNWLDEVTRTPFTQIYNIS